VFRNYYIDPLFSGSNSIKHVLPIICPDLGYSALSVRNGEEAQASWDRLVSTGDAQEKTRLANSLKEYCCLDTFAMVKLFQFLKELK